jgi:hypothetical protein
MRPKRSFTSWGCSAALLVFGGCTLLAPQTPEAFRREASGALLPRTGAVEVARPLREVAGAFRSKAPECLDRTATASVKTITNYQEIVRTYVTTYTPTVVETAQRVELHVQWRTQGEIQLSPPPANGAYRLIVDAYPVDGDRTRLEWFAPSAADDFLVHAVRGWASGDNVQCPDFTRQW